VINKEGRVIAGNGTLSAAKNLKWSHLAAVTTDLEETDSMAFAIADNQTGDLSEWDFQQLTNQLAELEGEGFEGTTLGWTKDEIAKMFAAQDEELTGEGGIGQGGSSSSDQEEKQAEVVIEISTSKEAFERWKMESVVSRWGTDDATVVNINS